MTETKELRTVMRGIWQYGSIYYSFLSIYLLGPASALAGLVLCLGPGPCPEGTLAAMAARLPDKSYFGLKFTPGEHRTGFGSRSRTRSGSRTVSGSGTSSPPLSQYFPRLYALKLINPG